MVAMTQAQTRDELILSHQGMARATAIAFAKRHRIPFDDACQEAYVALLVAADRYDPRRGASFFTFAVWGIRTALRSLYLREYRHAHPLSVVERGKDSIGRQKLTWLRQNVVEIDAYPVDDETPRLDVASSLPSPEERVTESQLMKAAKLALESAIRARKRAGKYRGKVDRDVLKIARRLL